MKPKRIGRILIIAWAAALALPAGLPGGWPSAARGDEEPPKTKPTTKKEAKKGSKKKGGSKKPGSAGESGESIDEKSVPADTKAEKKALAALGEGFKVRHTKHYSIIYDTSDEDLAVFSASVERTFKSCVNYSDKLGIPVKPPRKKLLTYYFDTHKSYSDFSVKMQKGERPQNNPGVYFPDDNYSMFYNMRDHVGLKSQVDQAEAEIKRLSERLRSRETPSEEKKQIRKQIASIRARIDAGNDRGGSSTESTVQHEVAHQVLFNIAFHNKGLTANPRWFVEGIAQLFETVSTGKAANWGAVNKDRLDNYRQLIGTDRLIPLADLLGNPMHLMNPATAGAIGYPQSWALVHYLNRAKRKELKEYIRLINERDDDFQPSPEAELETFEKAFGKPDEKWEKRWHEWMKRGR